MKQLSAEECITQILKDIDKRRTVDYADKKSVRRYNAAMNRIIEKANYLCDNYPDRMDLFIELLSDSDYEIAATCTSILFGLHNATRNHKVEAINAAERLLLQSKSDRMREFVWKVNVEKWKATLQKEIFSE